MEFGLLIILSILELVVISFVNFEVMIYVDFVYIDNNVYEVCICMNSEIVLMSGNCVYFMDV